MPGTKLSLTIMTLIVFFLSLSCASVRDRVYTQQSEEGALQASDCPPALYDNKLLIVGAIERVLLEPQGEVLEARIDTGAQTSSIDAREITPFERDGKSWVRFKLPLRDKEGSSIQIETRVTGRAEIKRHGEAPLERLVVTLRVVLGPVDRLSRFTLADRKGYDFPVLIGRSYLQGLAVVDVDRKLTLTPKPKSSSE